MDLYRVLLVDDEEDIRVGISRKMDWNSLGFTLVGEAENGEEALELAEQLHPDVVLTDIKMPFMDGLELCRHLKQSLPAAKLVVFSGFDDFEYARQAVGMNVFEYILKPINAPELSQVMTRLKEELDQQRSERQDMEALRHRYEENLPLLRELFYTRLLSGHIQADQIHDRAARYEIQLPEGIWTAALVHVDLPMEDEAAERDELLLLSIQDFFQSHFELEHCFLRAVLYNDAVSLLACMDTQELLYPFLNELSRLCILARSYLGISLTIGVGLTCTQPEDLHSSMEGARSALDYRVLVEGSRILYIGDLEPDRSVRLSFDEEDQRSLSTAVKLGTPEQVAEVIHSLVDRVRSPRLSPGQGNQFLLEIVTFLINLTRSGGADVEEVFGQDFNQLVSIADFPSLDDLGKWLIERCQTLRELLGQRLNGPVIGASGTVGYGPEYEGLVDLSVIGGISGKGLTLHGQPGNRGERLWETPSGLINSIGLQNPGVQHFMEVELPQMLALKKRYGIAVIANLGGHSEEEYVEGARLLNSTELDMIELNISCPNVKEGGMAYGVEARAAGAVTGMVRRVCQKPLIVKLSPQAQDIGEMCRAVEAAGADAISLTNTFQACAIDLEKRRPVFDNIFAGLSGPAVRPIALRMVWQAVGAVKLPVIGLGGIATGRDALEFIMAGAAAVQVGAANFSNPRAMETITQEMNDWMDAHGVRTLEELRGCAR